MTAEICFHAPVFDKNFIDLVHKIRSRILLKAIGTGLKEIPSLKLFTFSGSEIPKDSVIKVYIAMKDVEGNIENEKYRLNQGDVLVVKANKKSKFDSTLVLYGKCKPDTDLETVFLKCETRIAFGKLVELLLARIKSKPVGKQCIKGELKLRNVLGNGCYANVFSSPDIWLKFAIKVSKMKTECFQNVCNVNFSSWHEPIFLRLLSKAIEKKWCPNLPYLYQIFVCDSCELVLEKKKVTCPCISFATELASGTLKDFLILKPSLEHLHSALFQVMAGIYIIQSKYQIMHFDIKKENILYYRVKPGGYWLYIIQNRKYYVPNLGYLFVLNDFGISRTLSPDHIMYRNPIEELFRLGGRYAIISGSEFIPITCSDGKPEKKVLLGDKKSSGREFFIDRKTDTLCNRKISIPKEGKKILKNIGIDSSFDLNFFRHPNVVPPFEFYNDTQDCIRMFIGGKRTTQRGDHRKVDGIDPVFSKQLVEYVGKGVSSKDRQFRRPAEVLASCFIEDFFRKHTEYTSTEKVEIRPEDILDIFEA